MEFRIEYMPIALEHLRGLTARQQRDVLDTVEQQLTHEPNVPTRNRKALRPNKLATWELRIGDLRVFYDIELKESESRLEAVVVILAVGLKRGDRLWIGNEEIEL